MKKQSTNYQQEFYRSKIERAAKRKAAWMEFWETTAIILVAVAVIAVLFAILWGISGGIEYDIERTKLKDRISALEQRQPVTIHYSMEDGRAVSYTNAIFLTNMQWMSWSHD